MKPRQLLSLFNRWGLPNPNIAVWRSWEQTTRAAGLACIGISVFAQGEAVNPWSLSFGVVFLLGNVWVAQRVGELEAAR